MSRSSITAGFCTITKGLRFESSSHRIYVAPKRHGGYLVSLYRKDGTALPVDRNIYQTRAGALGYVKGFFRLPIAL